MIILRSQLLLGLFLAFLLSGCVATEFTDVMQPVATNTLPLEQPTGQTFVALHAGLEGIEVFLSPQENRAVDLVLHLRSEPTSTTDLMTATLPASLVIQPAYYRFIFPPLSDSHGRYYYAFLDPVPASTPLIGVGPGYTYLNGAMYQAHQAQDAQLSFRLIYNTRSLLFELAQAAIAGLAILAVVAIVFFLPGLALVSLLEHEEEQKTRHWTEWLGLAAGLGLAVPPLLLLWTDLLGLHLGPANVWLAVMLGAAILLYRLYVYWRTPGRRLKRLITDVRCFFTWANMTFISVVGLMFVVRLLVVRTLDAPAWGDSVQHAMMTQLFLDKGGLFQSWQPYAQYESLTIHYGFAAVAAFFSWIAGSDATHSTLIVGQLVNGMAVLALYPLAVRIANGNRWAGIGAVLTAGLISEMPAFYVNWGRYAQLTGQAVLPVALWLLWEVTEHRRVPWRVIGVTGVAVAGMTLSYYRMPFYLAAFMVAWAVVWALPNWKMDFRQWVTIGVRLVLAAAVTATLFLPWALIIRSSHLATSLEAGVNTAASWASVLAEYQIWKDIQSYVPMSLLATTLIAALLALFLRRRSAIVILLWAAILASLVAGRLIGLPGANLLQSFAIVIALYMPVGLLCGWLLGEIATLLQRHIRIAPQLLASALIAGGCWFAFPQLGILGPEHILVMRPDIRAMTWIREYTPHDAVFLVEGFRVYDGKSAVGADAGWWIPLLTGRRNTMPPQYALLNERQAALGYNQRVVDLVTALENTNINSAEGVHILCDWGITHVYIGQGQGLVSTIPQQLYAPDELLNNPALKLLYHEDRVYIFQLSPETCDGNNAPSSS